jgi:hypothetical protein
MCLGSFAIVFSCCMLTCASSYQGFFSCDCFEVLQFQIEDNSLELIQIFDGIGYWFNEHHYLKVFNLLAIHLTKLYFLRVLGYSN